MQHITGTIKQSIFGKSIYLVVADEMESCAIQFRGKLKNLAQALKIGDSVTVEYSRECHIAKSGTPHNNAIAISIEILNIEVKEPEILT